MEYVRQTLGVSPQGGGEHPQMGTCNRLLKLGESVYLEVIAVNPRVASPQRPRWFALDRIELEQAPRLATWVVRTNDISAAVAASPLPLGDIEPMSRGTLNWRITIPADGSLPLAGVAPNLIQWDQKIHPATSLPESGCRLVGLEGVHPEPELVAGVMVAIGFAGDFHVTSLPAGQRPHLVAHIRTPSGLRQLRGPGG